MRYKCIVAYDGYDFDGYQLQKHNPNTIQENIQKAISQVFKEDITIFGSGRTDKKVHAIAQVFHFDSNIKIPPKNLKKALNTYLPQGIRIKNVELVNDNFHARFSTHKKVYVYKIINSTNENVFNNRYFAYYKDKIDIDLLKKAANLFLGEHDFYGFTTNSKEEILDFKKNIYSINIKKNKNIISIEIEGSGFLKHQVRMMVGALLVVSSSKKDISYITSLLDQEKLRCGYKAMPQGLYLKKVIY